MKILTHLIILLLTACSSYAQEFSYLYQIDDDASVQNSVIRYGNNRLFAHHLAFTSGNFIPYLEQYDLFGQNLSSQMMEPGLPQAIQSSSQESFIRFGSKLLFSGDKLTSEDQNTFIQSFDFDGQADWRIDFAHTDSFSTAGVFLPVEPNACFHGMLREAENNDTQSYLSLIKFDTLGQVLSNKNILLPTFGQGFYFKVGSAAYTSDRLIWYLQFLTLPNTPKNVIVETDYSGEILNIFDFPATEDILLYKGTEDNFYESKYGTNGQFFGYCLSKKIETYDSQDWELCSPDDANYNIWAIRTNNDGDILQVGSVSNFATNYFGGFITKTDPQGNQLWSKHYVFPDPNSFTAIRSIDFLPDGRIATFGNHANPDGAFFWLMLLNEDGCYQGDCDDIIELSNEMVATSTPLLFRALQLYPNPAKEQVSILLEGCVGEDVNIQIYNELGQLMEARAVAALAEESQVFRLVNYPSGVYAVTIQTETNKKLTKLFVVR